MGPKMLRERIVVCWPVNLIGCTMQVVVICASLDHVVASTETERTRHCTGSRGRSGGHPCFELAEDDTPGIHLAVQAEYRVVRRPIGRTEKASHILELWEQGLTGGTALETNLEGGQARRQIEHVTKRLSVGRAGPTRA